MKLITTKINGKAYYLRIDAKVRDQQIGKFVASPGHQATLKGLTRKVSQQDYRLSVARVLHTGATHGPCDEPTPQTP